MTALKSNSNTVWFNFQTYIYIYMLHLDKRRFKGHSYVYPHKIVEHQ